MECKVGKTPEENRQIFIEQLIGDINYELGQIKSHIEMLQKVGVEVPLELPTSISLLPNPPEVKIAWVNLNTEA